jgi:hypothetical protein
MTVPTRRDRLGARFVREITGVRVSAVRDPAWLTLLKSKTCRRFPETLGLAMSAPTPSFRKSRRRDTRELRPLTECDKHYF